MQRPCAWMTACFVTLLGCGSQQLRLTSPDTTAGVGYTCTAANTCYPASLAIPAEGQPDEALPLIMPKECNGHIHEILIRDADSSSPEIDVTCAAGSGGDAGANTAPSTGAPPAAGNEPPRVDDDSIAPAP